MDVLQFVDFFFEFVREQIDESSLAEEHEIS